jgi:hypothetical protein
MYNKLWLMVPTYKRLSWIKRFIASAIDLADDAEANIGFVFCVNHKDEVSLKYLNEFRDVKFRDTLVIVEKSIQPNLSLYFNMMYEAVTKAQGDCVVSMLGDDMVFETKGYDTRLLNVINEKEGLGVFWCDDAYVAKDRCCVNMFVTKRFVDLTGKPFMCPFYKADMIDAVWCWVAKMVRLDYYLSDVVIHHFHSTGMTNQDLTFQRLRPLQVAANKESMQQIGKFYATQIACNLISSGIGTWNAL